MLQVHVPFRVSFRGDNEKGPEKGPETTPGGTVPEQKRINLTCSSVSASSHRNMRMLAAATPLCSFACMSFNTLQGG